MQERWGDTGETRGALGTMGTQLMGASASVQHTRGLGKLHSFPSLFRLKQCFEYLTSISMNYHLIQSSYPSLILPASAGHEVRNMLLQEHTGACHSPPHSASERPCLEKSVLPPRITLGCPKCQPCYPPTQKNHALFEQHHSSLPSQYSLLALAQ